MEFIGDDPLFQKGYNVSSNLSTNEIRYISSSSRRLINSTERLLFRCLQTFMMSLEQEE